MYQKIILENKKILEKLDNHYEKFNDYKSYLEFRLLWKKEYMLLSAKIRKHKHERKEYIWKYREQRDRTNKKRIKIKSNPNYSFDSDYKVFWLKPRATKMLSILHKAKQKSWRLKKEYDKTSRYF